MWINVTGLNIINALFSTVLVIITSLVGLYYLRKAQHASMNEIVDDISKIAEFREEANEALKQRISHLEELLSNLNKDVGHLQGQNQYLLASKIAWRRYAELLMNRLRVHGEEPPPRPAES